VESWQVACEDGVNGGSGDGGGGGV